MDEKPRGAVKFPRDALLRLARQTAGDASYVAKAMSESIDLFVYMAGVGYAREALDILVGSPSEELLEPLVVGLRLHLGEKVNVNVMVYEVGADVLKRIKDWQTELKGR